MAKIKEEKSSLEKVLNDLNKQYGAGTVIGGSDLKESIEVVNSGSLTLNIATNIGGLPIGKLIEMFGPESSGKSTLTLHFIAEFQKAGKRCALVDSEQSFDKKYATNLGVRMEELIYVQPECMEDGYNVIQKLIETGELGLVILDSHTALMPRKVVDGDVGDATIGLQARINSIALGKIHPLLKKHGCTMVAISQTRTNIGGYGDPNVATGGLGYKFYSDMRFKVSKQLQKDDSRNFTSVEVIKNKCGTPFGKAQFNINWGTGISYKEEVLDLASEKGIIKKSGSWYSYGEMKLGQGSAQVLELFNSNPEFFKEVEELVKKEYNVK